MTFKLTVRDAPLSDASWSFSGAWPRVKMSIREDGYYPSADVDPFPAYSHDKTLVQQTLDGVTHQWPLESDLVFSIGDREESGRSNAHATYEQFYEDDEYTGYVGHVFLSGKRVPPHPGHTRAIVGHEYGHNVEWWLERRLTETEPKCKAGCGCIIKEYADVRGHDETHHGRGGDWHASLHEIFACDFRLLVCGLEPEYWPHPGIERPEDVEGLRDWWTEQWKNNEFM